jgi:hypothetical protein
MQEFRFAFLLGYHSNSSYAIGQPTIQYNHKSGSQLWLRGTGQYKSKIQQLQMLKSICLRIVCKYTRTNESLDIILERNEAIRHRLPKKIKKKHVNTKTNEHFEDRKRKKDTCKSQTY